MTVQIINADCLQALREMPEASIHCCVTSPPYFGLRDYGHEGQIGLEESPDAFVAKLVDVFREVRRVLRDDGTLWLNLGDSYAGTGGRSEQLGVMASRAHGKAARSARFCAGEYKAKDLIGIPWMVAFALRADGWYLRQEIIWSKPNPMPESVRDRCTKSHEQLFLLSKSPRYYFDAEAIAEPLAESSVSRLSQPGYDDQRGSTRANGGAKTNGPMKAVARSSGNKARKDATARGCPEGTGMNVCGSVPWEGTTRNKRSVWTVSTKPFSGAHFATFPPALIEPCILAGCPERGTVLDPFGGAGTTGLVADRLYRNAVLIEISESYAALARQRIADDCPLFAEPAA